MTNNELQEGTVLNICKGCGDGFVVIAEFADTTPYCSPQCDGTGKESYETEEE